ncbi:hypothetical protein PANA5342_2405 [Pantoea ananatis LMG 5342]|nr:hypothetical protein PANA5342_2405 [Pantoea ananatis LMG 5342]
MSVPAMAEWQNNALVVKLNANTVLLKDTLFFLISV